MKICFILSTAFARSGGLETCAREFAQGLTARSHHVSLLAGASRAGADNLRDVRCVHVPCPQLSAYRVFQLLRPRWLATTLQALVFFAAARAYPAARRTLADSEVGVTFLEPETVLFAAHLKTKGVPNVSYFSGGMSRWWFRRDQSAVRVAISLSLADFVSRAHGISCDGAVTPGVSSAWLAEPMPAARTPATRLIYVGRLETNKGVGLLATLGDRLQSLYPTIQIRLIGTGPLASSLRRHRTLQLDGNLVHVHVPQALRASDVFVFPSHYESFGIAPLEAQAVGLPAVVSDLAALREATGDAAIYLPPTDLSAWFETLRTLIADAKRRESLARAGRAHAATMTWEVAAARLEPFIKLAQDQPQRRIGDRLTLPP